MLMKCLIFHFDEVRDDRLALYDPNQNQTHP